MQRICRICSSSPPADMQHHLLQTLILHGHTKYRLMTSFRCHSHNDISKAAFVSRYSRVLWPKIGTLKEWEHFLDLSLIFGLMRIAAMTNICDWIKEFSSYIKLGVSGAGNKYSVWLQFEWLQCCSAQSPGSWSYLRCRELQWQRPGKGTISHDLLTPGASSSSSDVTLCGDQALINVACLSVSGVWSWQRLGQGWRTMAWPQLFRSWLWEAEAPPAGRAASLPLVVEAAPGSGLTQASGQCLKHADKMLDDKFVKIRKGKVLIKSILISTSISVKRQPSDLKNKTWHSRCNPMIKVLKVFKVVEVMMA